MVDNMGREEAGQDVKGIFRDAISNFWKEFYLTCTMGEREKVPVLRHDFKEADWAAVAKILVKGFTDLQYFPLMLSQTFILATLLGEEAVPNEMIVKSFCKYLSKDEEEVVSNAMEKKSLDLSEDEELMELLNRFDCRKLPSEDNILRLIEEVAHKELLQKPRYISDSWVSTIQGGLRGTKLGTREGLDLVLKEKEPTTRKVIALLRCKTSSPAEQAILHYLKQFIRGLDSPQLATFLNFVTGADVMCIDSIHVEFTKLDGYARRPIAHICGCILELPSTYDTYAEFRTEFSNILAAGRWQNDII